MTAVLFDFDGVLYPETPLALEMYMDGATRTALHFGFQGTYEDARVHTEASTKAHRESSRIFIETLGLATWSEWLPVMSDLIEPTHLSADPALKPLILQKTKQRGVLSNAHARWLWKTMRHLDLHDIFDPAHVVTTDQVGYQGKARSDQGFRTALDRMGTAAAATIMIEDIPANLRIAKDLGMKTILVTHGWDHGPIPAWVDHVEKTTVDALAAL